MSDIGYIMEAYEIDKSTFEYPFLFKRNKVAEYDTCGRPQHEVDAIKDVWTRLGRSWEVRPK